jgi:hypothetical protein
LQTALSNLEVDNKELAGRTLLDVPGKSHRTCAPYFYVRSIMFSH